MKEQDANLPIVVIACKVFEGLLEQLLPAEIAKQITFLDYGLHQTPKILREVVQENIDKIRTPSLVILGYGLCGNGLDGIKAGDHILLIPRADDCIAILLGSYSRYKEEFLNEPGTYYLTKGWLESGSDPLKEYQATSEKYGEEIADWIMDTQYQHYKRLAFIAHQETDFLRYRPRAKEVADYCERWNMDYVEILGSEEYIQQLVALAFNIDKVSEDFLVIPPGGILSQEKFLRE